MKESSFLTSQAFMESLRYYPDLDGAGGSPLPSPTGTARHSGNTTTRAQWALAVPVEHLESDVRMRLGISPPQEEWANWQVAVRRPFARDPPSPPCANALASDECPHVSLMEVH